MQSFLVTCGICVFVALILHPSPVFSDVYLCGIQQTERENEDDVTEKELKKMNAYTKDCCIGGDRIKKHKYILCDIDHEDTIHSDSFQNCCAKDGMFYFKVDAGDGK